MLDTFTKATPEQLGEISIEMAVRKTREVFLLFPMGSQTDVLIAQHFAKLGVYMLVADPASVTAEDVRALAPKGIVLSGGPASVATEPPPFDSAIFDIGIELIGICLGFQMWAKHIGLRVEKGRGQYSGHDVEIGEAEDLFLGLPPRISAVQSHGDEIYADRHVAGFRVTAWSDGVVAAGRHAHLTGVQFHPEMSNTEYGDRIFSNFVFEVCKAKDRFPAHEIAKYEIAQIVESVRGKTVVLALSGGSDSSVVAHMIKEAQNGEGRLIGVYIKGIDRPDDERFVLEHFGNRNWLELIIVDATEELLAELAGKLSMKEKRVAIRIAYKAVLERIISERRPDVIAQGTLYTDISESGGGLQTGARKARIKLHHNVNLGFSVPEIMPLARHVKDSARAIGREIGVAEELLTRHPFPGVGLGVRIMGEITREKLILARVCDHSYHDELKKAGLYDKIWQSGAVVTEMLHPKTAGDDASEGPIILYWAINSVNGFTATAYPIPGEVHDRIQARLGSDAPSIGATAYRTSHKPYSTIEAG